MRCTLSLSSLLPLPPPLSLSRTRQVPAKVWRWRAASELLWASAVDALVDPSAMERATCDDLRAHALEHVITSAQAAIKVGVLGPLYSSFTLLTRLACAMSQRFARRLILTAALSPRPAAPLAFLVSSQAGKPYAEPLLASAARELWRVAQPLLGPPRGPPCALLCRAS
jgi:hypothetical protein